MADTVDAVAERMESIVALSRERKSPDGYFAAMYLGVTRTVQEGLAEGRFTTPERLEKLTAVFANRYLDAWDAKDQGGTPTGSWEVAFSAAAQWRPTLLQHLLLGMNAHINLDLGVAAAQVAPGPEIDALEPDFIEINDVLAGHVQTVQDNLNRVSLLYRFVDDITGPVDRAVINFSIARARAEAWKLAKVLAPMGEAEQQQRID